VAGDSSVITGQGVPIRLLCAAGGEAASWMMLLRVWRLTIGWDWPPDQPDAGLRDFTEMLAAVLS
jgi:hypothetical protein